MIVKELLKLDEQTVGNWHVKAVGKKSFHTRYKAAWILHATDTQSLSLGLSTPCHLALKTPPCYTLNPKPYCCRHKLILSSFIHQASKKRGTGACRETQSRLLLSYVDGFLAVCALWCP